MWVFDSSTNSLFSIPLLSLVCGAEYCIWFNSNFELNIKIEMRDALIQLLLNTVTLEYELPNDPKQIPKVTVSNLPDECYRSIISDQQIASLIYNGIVEYSFEEDKIDLTKLDILQLQALMTKLKYSSRASDEVKLKHGFFGEVLLYLLIQYFHRAGTVVSRGFFYNPLEKGETKGYDTYQMVINHLGKIELWFGEVKFREDYYSSLDEIFTKLNVALSDDYFNENVLAFVNHRENINDASEVNILLDAWMNNPDINLANEAKQRNFTFVYPILVVFEDNGKSYDEIIKQIVNYINHKYSSISISFSIPYKLFFLLLPVSKAKDIKQQVLTWISNRQPLI